MVHRDQPRGGTPEQKTNKRSVWGCGVAITEDSVFTPEGSFLVTDGVRISEQGTRGFDLCRDDIVATEKLLGSGASSDVYKAYLASDPSTPVALKARTRNPPSFPVSLSPKGVGVKLFSLPPHSCC